MVEFLKKIVNWFNSRSKVVRVILLFVPFVNWIFEMVIRWSIFAEKKGAPNLVLAILVTAFFGNIFGIVDAIFTIISNKMILIDL